VAQQDLVLDLIAEGLVILDQATSLGHDLTDGPGVDLPFFRRSHRFSVLRNVDLVGMMSVKIVIRDEGRQLQQLTLNVTVEAQGHDNKGKKEGDVIGGAESVIAEAEDDWLHSAP
jgi:hypothetical protein